MRVLVIFQLGLGLFAGMGLADGLTPDARQRISDDKGAFLEAAATALNWFGDSRGLNAAAIDDFIAAERAARRADVMQVLLAADLNADGAVSAAEVARLAPGLSPHARGRLIARQAQADRDGDATVDSAELQGFARFEAIRLVPDKRAEDLRLILLFDADGDGWVSFAEVKTAVAGIAA